MPDITQLREAARHGIEGLEQATANAPRAHRNLLVGLWAGRRLNRIGPGLAHYALEVMEADHQEAGDADIIRKLMGDFAGAGFVVTEAEAQALLTDCKRRAFAAMSQTD